MSKCTGCGSILTTDITKEGYTKNLDNKLCERCFRIQNYNEYKTVTKSNEEYFKIIDSIGNNLAVLVVDIFDIPKNFNNLQKHLKNDVLLVLTKFDLIPSNNETKYINYFKKNYNLNILDIIIVSSKTNYHLDELLSKIKKYTVNNQVYFIGYTNAGKSSIINKLIYNYSDNTTVITTSNLPSTTLNTIEINLNDLKLIDTPGIVSNNSITNLYDGKYLKKLIPNKKIKPIVYQIKTKQTIIIEDWFQIKCNNDNNLIFNFSNSLDIKRYYKEINIEGNEKHISVDKDSDIVIPGAGFITIKQADEFDIIVKDGVTCYIRNSIM